MILMEIKFLKYISTSSAFQEIFFPFFLFLNSILKICFIENIEPQGKLAHSVY